jgi:hypothetical protein
VPRYGNLGAFLSLPQNSIFNRTDNKVLLDALSRITSASQTNKIISRNRRVIALLTYPACLFTLFDDDKKNIAPETHPDKEERNFFLSRP